VLVSGCVVLGLEVLNGVSITVDPAVLCFLLYATSLLPNPSGPEGPVDPNAVLLITEGLGFEVLLVFTF